MTHETDGSELTTFSGLLFFFGSVMNTDSSKSDGRYPVS